MHKIPLSPPNGSPSGRRTVVHRHEAFPQTQKSSSTSLAGATQPLVLVPTSAFNRINESQELSGRACFVPIVEFHFALPQSSPTRLLLEDLKEKSTNSALTPPPITSTGQVPDPSSSEIDATYELGFSRNASNLQVLSITGLPLVNRRIKLQAVKHLRTYLRHLAQIRLLDNPPVDGPTNVLNTLYTDLLSDAAEFSPDTHAQILLCLAIIARRLQLEELEDLATNALNEALSIAASRVPRWAAFNSVRNEYWKGAVSWDAENDVTISGIVHLVRMAYANSDGDWVRRMDMDYYCPDAGARKSQTEETRKGKEVASRLCTSNGWRATSSRPDQPAAESDSDRISRSKVRAMIWNSVDKPAQLNHQMLCGGLYGEYDGTFASRLFLKANRKDYLTELVLKFVSSRFYYLRYHPEMQLLMEKMPAFTYDVLLRYAPKPEFLGCEGGGMDGDGSDTSSEWEEVNGEGRDSDSDSDGEDLSDDEDDPDGRHGSVREDTDSERDGSEGNRTDGVTGSPRREQIQASSTTRRCDQPEQDSTNNGTNVEDARVTEKETCGSRTRTPPKTPESSLATPTESSTTTPTSTKIPPPATPVSPTPPTPLETRPQISNNTRRELDEADQERVVQIFSSMIAELRSMFPHAASSKLIAHNSIVSKLNAHICDLEATKRKLVQELARSPPQASKTTAAAEAAPLAPSPIPRTDPAAPKPVFKFSAAPKLEPTIKKEGGNDEDVRRSEDSVEIKKNSETPGRDSVDIKKDSETPGRDSVPDIKKKSETPGEDSVNIKLEKQSEDPKNSVDIKKEETESPAPDPRITGIRPGSITNVFIRSRATASANIGSPDRSLDSRESSWTREPTREASEYIDRSTAESDEDDVSDEEAFLSEIRTESDLLNVGAWPSDFEPLVSKLASQF